jgi:Flp pilus assembly protein TadG
MVAQRLVDDAGGGLVSETEWWKPGGRKGVISECDQRQDVTPMGPLFAFHKAIRSARCGRGERGSALVEFAVATTLLLTMMFGAMDFGRALYTYTKVSEAARQGTRYAIVRGSSCTTWTTACPASATDVQTYLKDVPMGLNPSSMTVTTTWTPNKNPGSTVNVNVQYSFQFILPFLPSGTINMASTSQMVVSR